MGLAPTALWRARPQSTWKTLPSTHPPLPAHPPLLFPLPLWLFLRCSGGGGLGLRGGGAGRRGGGGPSKRCLGPAPHLGLLNLLTPTSGPQKHYPKHLLRQNFPSKGKLGEFSLRGKIFPLRDIFPLKIAFPFP